MTCAVVQGSVLRKRLYACFSALLLPLAIFSNFLNKGPPIFILHWAPKTMDLVLVKTSHKASPDSREGGIGDRGSLLLDGLQSINIQERREFMVTILWDYSVLLRKELRWREGKQLLPTHTAGHSCPRYSSDTHKVTAVLSPGHTGDATVTLKELLLLYSHWKGLLLRWELIWTQCVSFHDLSTQFSYPEFESPC